MSAYTYVSHLQYGEQLPRSLFNQSLQYQIHALLLLWLLQDEELTILRRKEKSDLRELKRVYHEYEDYINKHGADCNPRNRQYTLSLNHGVFLSISSAWSTYSFCHWKIEHLILLLTETS